ncbi:hypothetical protein [uncultured Coprobacter sp.]|uniref:hypothetical protein n=1 Tax=uncultured Coprobacter sp. TaxID=1720550 RepID=UPI002635D8F7|nr:hypothetical protein [uncultured Coprobacter sp.]
MERIITGRADMEEAARELKRGEIKEYRIKFEKNGECYRILPERFDAGEKKFYEIVGSDEMQPNPYYKGDVGEAAEAESDLDELDEEEAVVVEEPQAGQTECVESEEPAVENTEVADNAEVVADEAENQADVAEPVQEVSESEKCVECEEKFIEVNRALGEALVQNETLKQLYAKSQEENAELLAKLEGLTVESVVASAKLEELVQEIAKRGFSVELSVKSDYRK